MSFADTLRAITVGIEKIAAERGAAKSPIPPRNKYLTPRLVHRIAWSMGIPSQNNKTFDNFARYVTGTTDIRKMNQFQLHALVKRLPEIQGIHFANTLYT